MSQCPGKCICRVCFRVSRVHFDYDSINCPADHYSRDRMLFNASAIGPDAYVRKDSNISFVLNSWTMLT